MRRAAQARAACYIWPMKKTLTTASVSLLGAIAVSGCSQPAEQRQPQSLGMANPASVYCTKLGGKQRMEKTAAGEHGICVLPDGAEIEEWALFRRDHPAQ